MTDTDPDGSLTSLLRMQRQFGMALAIVGLLGLLATPILLPVAMSSDLGGAGDTNDPITQDDAREIREQLESGDYEGSASDYADLVTFDQFAGAVVRAAVFGTPAVSLLLLITGGYFVTAADAKGHQLDLDDYPDNPSVRDEFRMDDDE